MSHAEILLIIHELGGKAKLPEIQAKAKEKFPLIGLWKYVGIRLNEMNKRHMITFDVYRKTIDPNFLRRNGLHGGKRIWIINYEDSDVKRILKLN
jgi:hypothetical protein